MALLCTVLVSVWITWIFLIHLSVKVMLVMMMMMKIIEFKQEHFGGYIKFNGSLNADDEDDNGDVTCSACLNYSQSVILCI